MKYVTNKIPRNYEHYINRRYMKVETIYVSNTEIDLFSRKHFAAGAQICRVEITRGEIPDPNSLVTYLIDFEETI